MVPSSVSPAPLHPNAAELLRVVHRWCSPTLASAVQVTGQRVSLPWRVVRAILLARDTRLSALVPELAHYGCVLADDHGLTIIARPLDQRSRIHSI
jgi:hypothetical protein